MSYRDLFMAALPALIFLGLYVSTAYWMWRDVEKKVKSKAKKRLLQIAGVLGWPVVPYFYFLWPRPYAADPSKKDKPLGPVGKFVVRAATVILTALGVSIIAGVWRI